MAMNGNSFSISQFLVPVFNGKNYEFWSIKMKTWFKSQDLWHIVQNGYIDPDEENKLRENKKKDAKALFFIQQAIPKSIFTRVTTASTSNQAWKILQNEFQVLLRMQVTLRKYVDANHDVQEDVDPSTDEAHKMPQLKVHNLQKKISLLEKKQRNMMGEDIDSLSTKQLDRLEKQLQIAASRIYHRKIILLSHVSKLLTEEIKLMQEENRKLKTEVGNKEETSYSFTMPLIDALHVPPQASENDDSQVEADADLHLRLV